MRAEYDQVGQALIVMRNDRCSTGSRHCGVESWDRALQICRAVAHATEQKVRLFVVGRAKLQATIEPLPPWDNVTEVG